jgi:tetratricopeptide (TPR) repeat protein
MKAKHALLVLLILTASAAWGQATSDFSLELSPALNIPLGPKLPDGTPYYTIGGGVSLKGEYVLPFAPFLYTGLAMDVDLAPINSAQKSVTYLAIGPQLGVMYAPIPRLMLKLAGYGGIYFGMIEQGTAPGPFFAGLADVSFLLNPSLSLGVGGTYKQYFTAEGTVYQGIGVNLGAKYHIGAGKKKADLRITPDLAPIFPLFYSYYDKNPAGSLTLKNEDRSDLENVTVSFLVKQYMEQAKVCAQFPRLARGQQEQVPVYALFKDSIFAVTEGTKVAGEIQVAYRYLGREITDSYPITVTVNNRNALTWDDNRKAAAFVTAKDPLILSFAKRIAAGVDTAGRISFNGKFRIAMGLFEAMGADKIGYVQDPTTPYAELSADKTALDYLQFPGQTLAYKAGDCDDLSILYCALLESVGVRAAFITAPGHIFMAFSLDMEAEQARKTFLNPNDLIFRGNEPWVPVEITLVRDGFLKAWQIGAKEWREASGASTAGFYPIREAWKVYEPVGFSEIKEAIILPDSGEVLREYKNELERFIGGEVEPRASRLKSELKASPNNAKLLNNLGVLYARFGMLDEAAGQFQQILRGGEVAPALINLGNIAYLKGDSGAALTYYNRALKKAPDSSAALLGVAKASYELEKYDDVNSALAQLKNLDPAAASRFSFLGSGRDTARAAEAGKKEVEEWTEE